jgi:hypothetical protein
MRSVVITGVSTGIGKAAAQALIARGFKVFGSVRSDADAASVAATLGPNFIPLKFDVTDEAEVGKAAYAVADHVGDETLSGLVNNAGIAVPGPLLDLTTADLRHQLDVNLIGPMIVTRAFAPLLGTHSERIGPKGRIVMISSVAGRVATPFNGPYSASKFALEGLSEALRRELMLFGIDVIVVAPGAVATPIWDKAEATDMTRFAKSPFAAPLATLREYMLTVGRQGLPAERLGEAIANTLTARHPKPRYTVTPDPIQHLAMRLLPKRVVDRMLARRLGLVPHPSASPQ